MFKILYFFEHIKLVRDNVIKITDIQYSYNVELRQEEKTNFIIYIPFEAQNRSPNQS
jgi:hypothetical protein